MKYIACYLLCLLSGTLCLAQNKVVGITGKITDASTSEALVGVHVLVDSSSSGTATNRFGQFVIIVRQGFHRVGFSHIGYEDAQVAFEAENDTTLFITLVPQVQELGSIQISEQRESILPISASMVAMKPEEVKRLPALGGEPDVIKALQLMPGVQGGREGAAGLYVRGGGPDQNLILLDGTPIYNVTHMIGFLSAFNPDIIRSVSLTKGPGPARYGGHLSSVLDISLKEGDLNKKRVHGNVGVIGALGTIEGPIKRTGMEGKMSYLLSARRTYLDLFFLAFQPPREKYGYFFTDLVGKLSYITAKNGVYLSLYGGEDRFWTRYKEVRNETTERYRGWLKWGNLSGSLRWQGQLAPRILATASLARTAYGLKFSESTKQEDDDTRDTSIDETLFASGITDWSLKGDVSLVLRQGVGVKAGAMFTLHRFTPSTRRQSLEENGQAIDDLNLSEVQRLRAASASIYLESEFNPFKHVEVAGGLRLSQFIVASKVYFTPEPRLSTRYLLSANTTVEASVARATQAVHLLSRNSIGIPLDLWLPSTQTIRPEEAWQYSIGGMRRLKKAGIQLSADLYYKQMQHLIMPITGSTLVGIDATNWEDRVQIGEGEAYGLELLARKREGRFNGWIGYTLSRATRTFDSIDQGRRFPARYDRLHDVSVTGAYKFSERWSMSATWVFATGNAYWLPSQRVPAIEDFAGRLAPQYFGPAPETYAYAYGTRNSAREPNYHRLDLAFQHTKSIREDKGSRTLTIGAYNVYARRNPFFLTPKVQEDGRILYEQFSPFVFIPGINYDFKF